MDRTFGLLNHQIISWTRQAVCSGRDPLLDSSLIRVLCFGTIFRTRPFRRIEADLPNLKALKSSVEDMCPIGRFWVWSREREKAELVLRPQFYGNSCCLFL